MDINDILNSYDKNEFNFFDNFKDIKKGQVFDFIKINPLTGALSLKKNYTVEDIDNQYIKVSKKRDDLNITFPINNETIKSIILKKEESPQKRKRQNNFFIYLDGVLHKSFQDSYQRQQYSKTKKFLKLSQNKSIQFFEKNNNE